MIRRRSLLARLLLTQLVVIGAGSVTLVLVALAVGPGLYRRHVEDALGFVPPAVLGHLDNAFNQALWLSLALGIAAAVLAAAVVSSFASTRIARPLAALAHAAEEVAGGNYEQHVAVAGAEEMTVLARSFNQMADSLADTEARRRRLLSDVSHELRTPLATIDAYVEGLADGVVEPDPETWALIRTETARLARLTEDVTRVSRAEEGQLDIRPQRVAPNTLLNDAVRAAAPAYAAKGVTLELAEETDVPDVDADTDRLAEVFSNLLENALRHTPPGGRVTLTATRDTDSVLLTVADTGGGLSANDTERVFERFYRTDQARSRDRGGSGIGLTISRAIVEAHNGSLWAESPGEGFGTRFICQLPISRGAALKAGNAVDRWLS